MELVENKGRRQPEPSCPDCGSSMVMRTAKQGRNAGSQFWGCSTFPRCRGTVDATARVALEEGRATRDSGGLRQDGDGGSEATQKDAANRLRRRSVDWVDGTFNREGWLVRHALAGGSLRFRKDARSDRLAPCWLAREISEKTNARHAGPSLSAAVASMLRLLARGLSPPMHPEAETLLLNAHSDHLSRPISDRVFRVPPGGPTQFEERMCDSQFEKHFVDRVESWRAGAARWLVPQVPLDAIAAAAGVEAASLEAGRRCDFLYCPPWVRPVVIEVDGLQHKDAALVDRARDRLLQRAGMDTVRVPTSELLAGTGPALDGALHAVNQAFTDRSGRDQFAVSTDDDRNSDRRSSQWHPQVWGPIQTHRLVLAICEAVDAGYLSGKCWVIEVSDLTGLAVDMIGPYLATLAALAEIWGTGELAPEQVVFAGNEREVVYRRRDRPEFLYEQSIKPGADVEAAAVAVKILLQSDQSPSERLPDPTAGEPPLVVVRSTGVPVVPRDTVRTQRNFPPEHPGEDSLARSALEELMKAVFNKDLFREGQFEAVSTVLAGLDCAVLLPTGAGKSMIYQLAGLILPGRVLVVDPITSLIDDQIRGLTAQGIDRAIGITAQNSRDGLGDADGTYFLFVTPERLQRQRFRDLLASSARSFQVSLVVVDEAHCVSEWGHDFRAAYLNFGRTARRVCDPSSLGAPPILALTGTASRAVLSDVLFQLGITGDNDNHLVTPASFDRPELSYEVRRIKPNVADEVLKDVLKCLPADFNEQPSAHRVTGRLPGIVFIPTVNGRHRNMNETLAAVRSVIPSAAGYSTTIPRGWNGSEWSNERIHKTEMFKQDQISAIVATKAFGMGVDKPNVRWVVHFGLPQSIESFYQEVGRAGRDHRPARSVLILTEVSESQSRARLEPQQAHTSTRTGGGHGTIDDVSTVLHFHNKAFPSADEDAKTTAEVYRDVRVSSAIPLGGDGSEQNARKRALHRLAVLGVVDDYCLEGMGEGEKAVVTLADADSEQVADNLLAFVARSQPGRVEAFRTCLPHYTNIEDAVRECSRMLAEFVYDTIGRARQRSLFEMWELAGSGSEDGENVRRGILDYLTEGVPSAAAQRLAESDRFAFADWIVEWGGIVSTEDARQWRAAAGRLLGSYPDHPGLLASRAIAGALLASIAADELENGLRTAVENALDRYQADPGEAENMTAQVLDWLVGTPETLASSPFANIPERERLALAAAVVAAGRAALPNLEKINLWLDRNWKRSPELAVFKFADEIQVAIAVASSVVDDVTADRGTHVGGLRRTPPVASRIVEDVTADLSTESLSSER